MIDETRHSFKPPKFNEKIIITFITNNIAEIEEKPSVNQCKSFEDSFA